MCQLRLLLRSVVYKHDSKFLVTTMLYIMPLRV